MPPALSVADLEALVLRLTAATTSRDGLSRTAAATLTRPATAGAARLTDVASTEGVSRPSRLVDQGLVLRTTDPHDARIAGAVPALNRLADALRRSPKEVTR